MALCGLTLHYCSEGKSDLPAIWACRRLMALKNVEHNFSIILDALFRFAHEFPRCISHVSGFLIGGDATWDETTQRKLFSDAAAFNSPATRAGNNFDFLGGWTPTQGECGDPSDPPPMTITTQGASTGGGVCQFNSIRNEGNGIWRVAAKCVVGSETWPANIRLAVTNKGLNWTSEKGQQFYYRCPSTQ
jgi:hypothetical protein